MTPRELLPLAVQLVACSFSLSAWLDSRGPYHAFLAVCSVVLLWMHLAGVETHRQRKAMLAAARSLEDVARVARVSFARHLWARMLLRDPMPLYRGRP